MMAFVQQDHEQLRSLRTLARELVVEEGCSQPDMEKQTLTGSESQGGLTSGEVQHQSRSNGGMERELEEEKEKKEIEAKQPRHRCTRVSFLLSGRRILSFQQVQQSAESIQKPYRNWKEKRNAFSNKKTKRPGKRRLRETASLRSCHVKRIAAPSTRPSSRPRRQTPRFHFWVDDASRALDRFPSPSVFTLLVPSPSCLLVPHLIHWNIGASERVRSEYSVSRLRKKPQLSYADYNMSNPLSLVECESYRGAVGSGRDAQPFCVVVHQSVVFLMDVHSHMADTEIIGLLGGHWDERTARTFFWGGETAQFDAGIIALLLLITDSPSLATRRSSDSRGISMQDNRHRR